MTDNLQYQPPRYAGSLLVAVLICVYIFLGYYYMLFSPPRGVHFIRQVDSLSFIRGYIRNGLSFLEPEVYSLNSIDGKAACEFPVIYYITALLYKLTGEREFYLRLLNLCIVSLGFYHLFRLSCILIKDVTYSLLLILLFFSSTVLVYYANNFLPDAPALGFTLSGWYFFYRYFYDRGSKRSLITAMLFFTLGSLIKVTYFINPLAALLALLAHDYLSEKRLIRAISKNSLFIAAFILSLAAVAGWYLYATSYNIRYSDQYFLTHTRPIWEMTGEDIAGAWWFIRTYFVPDYFYMPIFILIAGLSIAGLVMGKLRNILFLAAGLLLLGGICYLLLFFHQFHYHDYYALALFPALIFLTLNGWNVLQGRLHFFAKSIIPKAALAVLCVMGLVYSKKRLADRNTLPYGPVDIVAVKLKDGKDMMREAKVPYTSSLVVVIDDSPNAGLYFLDRKGWNVHDTSAWAVNRVREAITWGAEYVVLTNRAYLENPGIAASLGEKRLDRDSVLVYKAKRPEDLK